MKSITAEKLVSKLKILFARYGLPKSVLTDNGPAFKDSGFQKFLKDVNITHHFSTPYWPQANGAVERQNRNIMKRLRIASASKKDWREELVTYLSSYRATPHSVTGSPPAELFFGRRIRSKIPDLQLCTKENLMLDEEIRDRDLMLKDKGKLYGDLNRHAKPSPVEPGDAVLMQQARENKLSTPFRYDPLTVIERHGNSVLISDNQGKMYRRNTSHVKPYVQRRQEDGNKGDNHNELSPMEDVLDVGKNLSTSLVKEGNNEGKTWEPQGELRSMREHKKPSYLHDYMV
jgi:hypothetical protein